VTYFFETYGCQTCRKQVRRDMPEAPESCAERISRAERKENGNAGRDRKEAGV